MSAMTAARWVARLILCLVVCASLKVEARESEILDLSIKGTKLLTNTMGMPSSAEGVVYFRGGIRDGDVAGSYTETLTPVLDPELGLIGTRGISVFKFSRRQGDHDLVDELTTHNDSSIVGEIPSRGILLVESTGRIESGSGRFAGVNGRLYTSSRVKLGVEFLMDVRLRIVIGTSEATPGIVGSRGHVCAECVAEYHARSVQNAWGAAASKLRIAISRDGTAELRYPPRFKRGLLRRMLDVETPESSTAVSERTGVGQAVLERWAAAARVMRSLSGILKGVGKPTPAVRQLTFEEKLGVVLKAASFRGADLDAYLSREGMGKGELEDWRVAIEAAIARVSTDGKSTAPDGNEFDKIKRSLKQNTEAEKGSD